MQRQKAAVLAGPAPRLRSSPRRLLCAAILAAALLGAAIPAHAAEVTVVGAHGVKHVNDPSVPPASEVDQGLPRAPGAHASGVTAHASSKRGRRAVGKALKKARKQHKLGKARYTKYVRIYRKARRVLKRLHGARRSEFGYVVASLEGIALRHRLIASRMRSLFVQLQRNYRYWPSKAFPSSRDYIQFRGSQVLYQYFVGRGLQMHPLANWIKANNMHGDCTEAGRPKACSRKRLASLLDELTSFAVRRSKRFIAWEYDFEFDGGIPPWMSGMAQSTAVQALGRASNLLGRPGYTATARKALGAFETHPPTGVRTRGFRGGIAYLQYSFAPRTYIFNAFTQAVLGLRDFGKDTGDARATKLFHQAEPELRREIPFSDLGDWTMYSYRGEVSDQGYHELLREVLQSMCVRKIAKLYCTYAKRYRGYQVDPPKIELTGPTTATKGSATRIRFKVTKLSAVELKISREGRVGYDQVATFSRGTGSFVWKPKATGAYRLSIGAKELRTGYGKRDRDTADIEVAGG